MSWLAIKQAALLRNILFVLCAFSWLSGVTFFCLDQWVRVEGDFGPQQHPWQYPILRVHGACAFLMLMAYGALLAQHVPHVWKRRRMRGLGLSLVAILAIQAVTAYLLYYLAQEDARQFTRYLHLGGGLALPLLLAAHAQAATQQRRQRRSKSYQASLGQNPL